MDPGPGGGGPASLLQSGRQTPCCPLFLQPCYETVKMWLQENLLAVGIFGLCTALVQVGGRGPGSRQHPPCAGPCAAWRPCPHGICAPRQRWGSWGMVRDTRGEVTFDIWDPESPSLLVDQGGWDCAPGQPGSYSPRSVVGGVTGRLSVERGWTAQALTSRSS